MKYNIFQESPDFIQKDNPTSIEDVLSEQAIEKISFLVKGEADHLLIRGVSISDDLPTTPKEIRQIVPIKENNIITIVGEYLGNVSEKGVENSIRFDVGGNNNTETWHNHRQYKYSVFLCLKDDPNPRTYLLSANTLIKESNSEMKELLLSEFSYIQGEPPFPLIERHGDRYAFSRNIFDRSELEERIKDLDLPDALHKLDRIFRTSDDQAVKNTVKYLVDVINNFSEHYTFTKGDLMIVEESSTIRFSPEYKPSSKEPGGERWILTLSVDH